MVNANSTNRRRFLQCAGVTFAVPLLESLQTPATAKETGAAPLRGIFVSSPCGIVPDQWYPSGNDTQFAFSRCLKPLEPFREKMTIFRGLWHSRVPGGGHSGEALLLTGADPRSDPSKDWTTTVSADQVLAKKIGMATRFESMQLCGSQSGGFGSPQTISFTDDGVPMESEWRPGHVFDALFGDTRNLAEKKAFHAQQRSILDLLRSDIAELDRELGQRDRQKLDEYLTSVRGIERRLQREAAWMDRPKPNAPMDEIPYDASYKVVDAAHHMEMTLELLWAAMTTDSCRVFSYVIGNMGGGLWTSIGAKLDKHSLSHHRGNEDNIEMLARMDVAQSQQLAAFMKRLQDTEDVDGSSMLDNVAIFTGSGMQDANAHSGRDLPITVLGGSRLFNHGRVRTYEDDELSNLLLTLLQAFGVEQDSFAASTTVYSEFLKT